MYKNFIYENSIGDFEVFLAFCSTAILATLIYNVITILSFKDLTRRFGLTKISRKDFYECGFRPQSQKVIVVSVQFLLICVFFLLYDIELVFLFPFVSGYTHQGWYDTWLLVFFFFMLLKSLHVDYERHALHWHF